MTHLADDDMPLDHEEQAAEWCWRIADRVLTESERDEFDARTRATARRSRKW
jgi:transmembrane sensor